MGSSPDPCRVSSSVHCLCRIDRADGYRHSTYDSDVANIRWDSQLLGLAGQLDHDLPETYGNGQLTPSETV